MLEVADLGMGFSYDINVSDLSAVTNSNGGFEVSLGKDIIKNKANISYR